MPICEVIGFRVNLGPIRLFPIAGPEVPVQHDGIDTQVELTRQIELGSGETYGVIAQMVNPDAVDLYDYYSGTRDPQPLSRLMHGDINRHPLTRGRLRWVRQAPGLVSEAA